MNFDLVQRRIVELNVLAGEGECFVRPTATGARLAKREPIQLGLYRDGIVMFDGPFRSYQERSTQVSTGNHFMVSPGLHCGLNALSAAFAAVHE